MSKTDEMKMKMKILCLHGGGTSATILQTQLGVPSCLPRAYNSAADLSSCKQAPVIYEISKTKKAEFHFVNGPVEALAATEVAEHYEGPYYRFFDTGAPQITQITGAVESSLRQTSCPEDYGRSLRENGLSNVGSARACDFVQQYVDEHDGAPFDGLLGFSEGASVAASLILRQYSGKGTSTFKFAIFICGFPPFRWDREDIVLPDETAERIDIPTAHIVGSKDAGYQGSRALYKLCNSSSASILDHGGAHTIPWDLASTRGIANEIRSAGERSQSVSVA